LRYKGILVKSWQRGSFIRRRLYPGFMRDDKNRRREVVLPFSGYEA
jgi:hypothetical protein